MHLQLGYVGSRFKWTIGGEPVEKPPGWPAEVRWPLASSGRLWDAEIPFVMKWADKQLLAARALGAASVEARRGQRQAGVEVKTPQEKPRQLGRQGRADQGSDIVVNIALQVLASDPSFASVTAMIR